MKAHERLSTQAQAGRADPGTGQPASSMTVTTSQRIGSADSLEAYIGINDNQRMILERDQHFTAFQLASPWAHVVTDSATIAALNAEYELRSQRRLALHHETMQALARAGNTDPIQLYPAGLDPRAPEFRPSLTQGGHLRQTSQGSTTSHGRQASQGSHGGQGRNVSQSSMISHGRQASQDSQTGHGRHASQGSQMGQ